MERKGDKNKNFIMAQLKKYSKKILKLFELTNNYNWKGKNKWL